MNFIVHSTTFVSALSLCQYRNDDDPHLKWWNPNEKQANYKTHSHQNSQNTTITKTPSQQSVIIVHNQPCIHSFKQLLFNITYSNPSPFSLLPWSPSKPISMESITDFEQLDAFILKESMETSPTSHSKNCTSTDDLIQLLSQQQGLSARSSFIAAYKTFLASNFTHSLTSYP